MFKPMDKKIIAILRSKILLNWPYGLWVPSKGNLLGYCNHVRPCADPEGGWGVDRDPDP